MLTDSQKQNAIRQLRGIVTAFVGSLDDFNAFNLLYTALDLGGILTDEDFTADSAGITRDDWVAAVGIMQELKGISNEQRTTLSKVLNI